jgi:hypothetical protein
MNTDKTKTRMDWTHGALGLAFICVYLCVSVFICG